MALAILPVTVIVRKTHIFSLILNVNVHVHDLNIL